MKRKKHTWFLLSTSFLLFSVNVLFFYPLFAQDEKNTQRTDRTEVPASEVYMRCYFKCRSKITEGVIQRAEGMACMDLCISDIISSVQKMGALQGQAYVKLLSGNIVKGLKIPVFLLDLNKKVEDSQNAAELKENKEKVLKLIEEARTQKVPATCNAPGNYDQCGYGLEKALRQFVVAVEMTDINEGVFSFENVPEGDYVILVDWFYPQSSDGLTGSLYRWIREVKIEQKKRLMMDINDGNINFILTNFSRAYIP
ncbi:MAG: hypothetical protein AB1742_14360 [bacterium]